MRVQVPGLGPVPVPVPVGRFQREPAGLEQAVFESFAADDVPRFEATFGGPLNEDQRRLVEDYIFASDLYRELVLRE